MRKFSIARWLHRTLIVAAVILLACGLLAWSFTYRVQSAGLFAFALLCIMQWAVSKPRPVKHG